MRPIALGLVALSFSHPALAQVSPSESRLLESLDPARALVLMKRLSEDVVSNRSGAGAGTAVAGSRDERLLADFIARAMAGLGFEVRRESFPVRAYESGEVTLLASGTRIPAVTLHTSPGTWGMVDGVPYRRGGEDDGRASSPGAPARIAKLEAQAEAYLREALFIVTGRLEQATAALSRTPVPRGGTE